MRWFNTLPSAVAGNSGEAVAWAVGARGAIVKTGYGRGELEHHSASWERPPDLVAEHLLEAVSHIVAAPVRP